MYNYKHKQLLFNNIPFKILSKSKSLEKMISLVSSYNTLWFNTYLLSVYILLCAAQYEGHIDINTPDMTSALGTARQRSVDM